MGKKRSAAEARHGSDKSTNNVGRQKGQANASAGAAPKRQLAVDRERTGLIFTPRPDWHATELRGLQAVEKPSHPPRAVLDEIHQYADSLLESESSSYANTHMSSSSSHKFLSTIMSSGTLEDKVSALTLLVQESPLHTRKAFENLLNLARKKSRSQALTALAALKDLLGQGVVLPPDRKLRAFLKQPALLSALQGKNANWKMGDKLPGSIEKVHLVSWAYEDWLKRTYFELLQVLELWCNDEVQYARSRSITYVWELLKEKPEQEENLLRLLINKLGDKEKKIASRASYLLLQLQVTHPAMKLVIINAIESELLFKPNQSAHAKYYAIITLNQTILSTREEEVANKLLEIYFTLFVSLLKSDEKHKHKKESKNFKNQGGGGKPGKKALQKQKLKEKATKSEEELGEKMIAQILTGVNRAFPFAKTDDATFESQLDTIFRVTHSANFNTGIQALLLIQQISTTKHFSTDRFYRTLYESLLDPRLLTSSKQILYLNLLYRSLKSDVSIKRVQAFVKRLLQIISLHDPPFVCGVLYLIHDLETTFPSIKSMVSTPELSAEDEEEKFVDAPETPEDVLAPKQDASTGNATEPSKSAYDGRKRNPEHSNADRSCLWELLPLLAHFHPSVQLFAARLLYAGEKPSKPDPASHTLMHFLDRFAYRSARTKAAPAKGASIMQPLVGQDRNAAFIVAKRAGAEITVNSEQFWSKKAEDVGVDEVFFHKYFKESGKGKRKRSKIRGEGSDAEEDEVWKALVRSRPEVEGDMDDDGSGFGSGADDWDDEEDEEAFAEAMESDGEGEGGDQDVEMVGFDDEEEQAEDIDGELDFEFDDEDGFVGSDDEVPVDVAEALAESDEEVEKKGKKEGRSKKKRKLKHLPTFASADDYAKLLEEEEDGV